MRKVRNNHNAPLSFAGVTIRPGTVVGIEDEQFERGMKSHAAKIWFKQELLAEEDTESDGEPKTEKQELMERAVVLGLTPSSTVPISRLRRMVKKAEEEQSEE